MSSEMKQNTTDAAQSDHSCLSFLQLACFHVCLLFTNSLICFPSTIPPEASLGKHSFGEPDHFHGQLLRHRQHQQLNLKMLLLSYLLYHLSLRNFFTAPLMLQKPRISSLVLQDLCLLFSLSARGDEKPSQQLLEIKNFRFHMGIYWLSYLRDICR